MTLPLNRKVRILAEHRCGLIALAKPCGVRSHPNTSQSDRHALLQAPYDQKEQAYDTSKKGGVNREKIFLLNRLDAPTSGVILMAKSFVVAEAVRVCFAEHQVEKHYWAWVKGNPKLKEQWWRDSLEVKRSSHQVRTRIAGKTGKTAATRVRFLRLVNRGFICSLLELIPETGRTHQLRVQCAHHGHPILGDKTYGNFALNRLIHKDFGVKRLMLHNSSIELNFVVEGKQVRFRAECPLPSTFEAFPESA